ncbi:hypothetical protein M3M50_16085 [Pseudomonas bijieensis]|uniref:hypothetical protein n=1 Tax=Pseudomonas bijieensis TaxID=2681983 RepID=UPI00200CC633|nr:hypothetical protein [Pseudomonas bijieensis]UQI28496.1 hypothetical protein M3M50_16085 [Pseudomonas bijieensis]
MALTLILGCDQDDFNARRDGSCEGISFYFCMRALDLGPLQGLADLLEQRNIDRKVERIMTLQDLICDGLMSSGTYETGIDGKPISDPRGGNLPGIRNQGKAIQEFHKLYAQEAQTLGCKSIGTLSSFFEGGFVQLLTHTIQLLVRSRRGAALIAMQSAMPHAVALAYDGSELYFFDPNSGVHTVANLGSAATDLERHLTARYTVPSCVHANMFKLNH